MDFSSGTSATQRATAPPPPLSAPFPSAAVTTPAITGVGTDGSEKKLVSLLAFHHLLLEFVREFFSSTTAETAQEQEQEHERRERKSRGKHSLDAMGQSVGHSLCEKHLLDLKPFGEDKVDEIIVWMCKNFWTKTFGKRIDSLKTNNRGTFVLLDNNFALTKTFADNSSFGSGSDDSNNSSASMLTASASDGGQQQREENNSRGDGVEEHALYFASQIVKGALNRVNVNPQSVKGEFVSKRSHRAVTFTIIL